MQPRRFAILFLSAALAVPVAVGTVAAASLQPYSIITVPSEAEAVAIGDVTGDGRNDIVFTTAYANDPANDFSLFVLPQQVGGTLGPRAHYTTAGTYSARPQSLDIGDVTGDGRADVVIGLDRTGIQVFPGQADGALGAPLFLATTDSSRVAIGNLALGGALDVAGAGWGSNTVTVFSGGAAGLTVNATYAAKHGGYDDMEIGDVSSDGRDDIVMMSGQSYVNPNFSVLTQLTGGGFAAAAEYATGANTLTHGVGIGDVSGDGKPDVVVSFGGNRPSSKIAVFAQTTGGALAAPVIYDSYDIPEPVEVADLDADGRGDVVTVHGGWNAVGVYGGQSNATLGAEALYGVPYASHYNPQGLAIGDVNGDGSPDIVEADYNYGLIVIANSPPPPTVPGAPTLDSATAGNAAVALAWSAPASNGGATILSYTATASPGGATCSSAGLGCTVSGLTNGTTYAFTVHATNSVGSGPESNARSATPATVPTAPLKITAKSGGSGITVGWATPTSTGGSAITAYRIYRGATSTTGSLMATVNASARSFIDTTAPKRTKVYYWVTAINAVGESPRSAVVSATGR